MPFNNYSPSYVFKGAVQADNAPSNDNDLVRKQDVAGLSFIQSVDSDYFSVDSNGALSASNLLISDVEVNTTDSSLANFVSNSAAAANLGVGDVVILTNPTPSEMYIVKSGTGSNVSDYQEIQSGLTQGEVLSHISAGTGITISAGGVIATTITQYADSNARAAISATGNISYNSSTGVISTSLTQYADSNARAALSAGTGLTYNSSTGQFACSITQYTDALARAAISASSGSGLSYNSSTGALSVNNDFFRKTFTNQSFTANTAKSFQHDLGEKLVHVSVYDSNDELIHAQVSLTDADNLEITSSSSLTGVSVVVSI